VLETSANGTVVTSRYFLQTVSKSWPIAYGVRAVAVDLNDFRHELDLPSRKLAHRQLRGLS